MRLEIKMTGYDAEGTSRVVAVVTPLLQKMADEYGITEQHLDRVVVADEAHFASLKVRMETGCTSTVGKTFCVFRI